MGIPGCSAVRECPRHLTRLLLIILGHSRKKLGLKARFAGLLYLHCIYELDALSKKDGAG
jgi:hypothetical protein